MVVGINDILHTASPHMLIEKQISNQQYHSSCMSEATIRMY